MVFTIECSNHSNIICKDDLYELAFVGKKKLLVLITLGGYSSIGRATVCGTVSSLFESGYPP